MLAYWPYILLALLLLVLGTAVILYFVLRRARMRAAPKTAALAPAPVVAVEDPSTAGLYSPLAALGLNENERIAGFIFIGTSAAVLEERMRPEFGEVVSEWRAAV